MRYQQLVGQLQSEADAAVPQGLGNEVDQTPDLSQMISRDITPEQVEITPYFLGFNTRF